MQTIGFIGLGHMGNPMVKNFLKKNVCVRVYDIAHEAVKALVNDGAIAATSPADAAKDADVVFTMLQTGEQVKQACINERGIFSSINKNALYIDSSSIDIGTSKTIHQEALSRGIAMLDAPVSGGVAAATAGSLTMMVGGDENHFQKAVPFLQAIGKKIIYAGKSGSGAAAKICNNMILGVSMIAVCEAFALANKLELDPKKFFEIANNASGQCWSLSHYCPWPNIIENVPANNDYQPGFTASMMLKDLNLSQNAAELVHADTHLGKAARDLYQQFVEAGDANTDFSGIIQMLI